jgi:signal transduction histidine kinase/CheY-like chemotaxis protein
MPESGAVGAEPAVFEWRASHADGRVMELEVAAVEVTMRGRPMWLASVRDITGRRRAEEERMRIEAELQRTQRLESLTMLAGGVAHDFNNILQAIIGNTDLILEGASGDGPLRARLEAVRSAALRAAALAQQMLAYSGHGRFESAEIGISDLVRETAALVEAGVPKRVRVEYELDPAVPPVRGDRMQLRQAFIGLVTNAAESYAGREGVVRVRTWCEREEAAKVPGMRVEGTVPEGDAVVLEISDTGCGIDAGTLDRIFEPFYTNKATGRGLGLASVVGIARRHAAAVAVRSVVGGGSTFRLVLPVARSQPSEADAGPVPSEAPSAAAASPGRLILIADDERDIREMASAVLEMAGFSVVTAADGLEAVSTFRARQSEFGLVVLDMSMPRMGGDEALREIRALRPDIPAVIASGYSDEDATASVTGLGFTGFLQKPFRTKELTAMARHALGGDAAPGDEQVGQASSN